MIDVSEMPEPKCPYGYTVGQLHEMFPGKEFDDLSQWMRGQTMMLCNGEKYDHDTKQTVATSCAPGHGPIVYTWDVKRFVQHLPVID